MINSGVRSYLYVPGDAVDKWPKALASGADAVIIDLEDAVSVDEKDDACRRVVEFARGYADPRVELWVRVNGAERGRRDVLALREIPTLAGLVLAKAEVDWVREAGSLLAGTELVLSPLLETASAVLDAREIAAGERVLHLQLGEYDLCAEVGITPSSTEQELGWARSQIVFASAAAGIEPPVAPVSIEIADRAGFASSTRRAAGQGFLGRACIHPAQLGAVHDVFTPTADEVATAQRVVDNFDARGAAKVYVDQDGRLVDEATVRSARRTLHRSAATMDDETGPDRGRESR